MKNKEIDKLLDFLKGEDEDIVEVVELVVESEIEDIFTITSYAQVCKNLKREVLTVKDFTSLPEHQREKALHQHMVSNLEDCFNQGWKPNWTNSSEQKFFPWFGVGGGWVFINSSCYYFSSGGQPGFYKSIEISDHIGKYFLDVYKPILG